MASLFTSLTEAKKGRMVVMEAPTKKPSTKPDDNTSNGGTKGASDYTEEVDTPTGDTEVDDADIAEDTPDDTEDSTDDSMDYSEEDVNMNDEDDGSDEGEVTDDNEGTDYSDDSMGDDATDTDTSDDNIDNGTGEDTDMAEDSKPSDVRNATLITDFKEMYQKVESMEKQIFKAVKRTFFANKIYSVVGSNLESIKDDMYSYMVEVFSKKSYPENLLQYSKYIEAIKLNVEMLKKIGTYTELT